MVSSMFCKAKSEEEKNFFSRGDFRPLTNTNGQFWDTSFQYFSPRIPNLLKFWSSNFKKRSQNRPQNVVHGKGTNRHAYGRTLRLYERIGQGPILWKCKEGFSWTEQYKHTNRISPSFLGTLCPLYYFIFSFSYFSNKNYIYFDYLA